MCRKPPLTKVSLRAVKYSRFLTIDNISYRQVVVSLLMFRLAENCVLSLIFELPVSGSVKKRLSDFFVLKLACRECTRKQPFTEYFA